MIFWHNGFKKRATFPFKLFNKRDYTIDEFFSKVKN